MMSLIEEGRPVGEWFSTEAFANNYHFGKYSAWAEKIDTKSLVALLALVGVYGRWVMRLGPTGGGLPEIKLSPCGMDRDRMLAGLLAFATVYQSGKVGHRMASRWEQQFSQEESPWTLDACRQLGEEELTRWAAGLSEQALALLFWMVGEYCVRAYSIWGYSGENDAYYSLPLPEIEGDAQCSDAAREAVRLILRLYRGQEVLVQEIEKIAPVSPMGNAA